jgi:ABC-2 type transport system permease protein
VVEPTQAHIAPPVAEVTPLWVRWLIRTRAYFRKEINELRRQPLLILSLVGGPLLVLVLFGASFQNSTPLLRTIVVLPPGGLPGITPERIRAIAGTNFAIVDITEDAAAAQARLASGEIDVVQELPPDVFAAIQAGRNPTLHFTSNAIDPMVEGWVQYLAYAEVNEINKELLRQQTVSAQQEAASIQVKVINARGSILELESVASVAQREQTQRDIRTLRELLVRLTQQLPPAAADSPDIAALRTLVARLIVNLDAVDKAISDGSVKQRLAELRTAADDLTSLDGLIQVFVAASPDTMVAPVQRSYSNIRGAAYAAVVYYAPGVLALLIQHTAITLGALALVRERLMGAFELFRVAPVHMIQLLVGKYLAYTLFISLTAVALFLMLLLFGIPLLGSIWQLVAVMLLLTVASLGIGFVISAVSKSDSQAIQLAMISLLLSIFFSGFFISLDSFAPQSRAVSYSLPITHGIAGFQNVLLRGIPVAGSTWLGLIIISLVSAGAAVLITRRQFQYV